MPNDYENPKYTNKNEYHAGDGPFQFPWWAIVIAFVVWWPLGLVFIGLNAAMKNGRLGGFEQKAREATRDRTASGAKPVYTAEFRPIYDTPAQPQPKASAPHAAPQQAQVRAAGKKLKGAALATIFAPNRATSCCSAFKLSPVEITSSTSNTRLPSSRSPSS